MKDFPWFSSLHGWWRTNPAYNTAFSSSDAGQNFAAQAATLFNVHPNFQTREDHVPHQQPPSSESAAGPSTTTHFPAVTATMPTPTTTTHAPANLSTVSAPALEIEDGELRDDDIFNPGSIFDDSLFQDDMDWNLLYTTTTVATVPPPSPSAAIIPPHPAATVPPPPAATVTAPPAAPATRFYSLNDPVGYIPPCPCYGCSLSA